MTARFPSSRANLYRWLLVWIFVATFAAANAELSSVEERQNSNATTVAVSTEPTDFQERWIRVEQELKQQWQEMEAAVSIRKQQMDRDLESLRISLEHKKSEFEQEMAHKKKLIQSDIQKMQCALEKERRKAEEEMKRQFRILQYEIETQLFRQRKGIVRVYKSIQNFLGVTTGIVVAFFSSVLQPVLGRWSIGLQSSVLARRALTRPNTNPTHPWVLDVVSASVLAAVALLPNRPRMFDLLLTPITLTMAVSESISRILEKWNASDDASDDAFSAVLISSQKAKASLAAVVFLCVNAITTFTPPWLQTLLATSLIGSNLILESVADEIVGNWMRMLRHVGPERLNLHQRVYNGICHIMEKHVLHPAQEALHELEMALQNEDRQDKHDVDDNRMNLNQKIKAAVARNFRLRLVWSLAGVGMLAQLAIVAFVNQSLAMSKFNNMRPVT